VPGLDHCFDNPGVGAMGVSPYQRRSSRHGPRPPSAGGVGLRAHERGKDEVGRGRVHRAGGASGMRRGTPSRPSYWAGPLLSTRVWASTPSTPGSSWGIEWGVRGLEPERLLPRRSLTAIGNRSVPSRAYSKGRSPRHHESKNQSMDPVRRRWISDRPYSRLPSSQRGAISGLEPISARGQSPCLRRFDGPASD
jgi:hypothetical protein